MWHALGMARAYSVDLRERLLQARDAGLAPVEIERTLGISTRTQRRWVQQRRTTGDLTPRHSPGRPPKIGPEARPALHAQVLAAPDATLAEHCARWAAATSMQVSTATMARHLRRMRLPLKKKSLIAQERDEAGRRTWRSEVAGLDPATLVFLDETSTPTTLTPLRARAPRGERAVGRVPRGRWHAVTLLATLTPAGMGAAMLLDGAADQPAFEAFVAQQLVPSLRPGQTVILDNLSVHKSPRAREAIEAAGCALRFLPTYSPDFNPIEHAFAKIKQRLRRAEARSFAALQAATGPALDAITAADAHAFFRAAGYALTPQPGQPLR